MEIWTEQGAAALAAAETEADPASLAAATRLRRRFPPELAAAALTQVSLRRRARAKCPRADQMFFTPDALEQASRWQVATWRATRFRAAGVGEVWDLGCGIGADAVALGEAGLRVHGVEADPATARMAQHNLGLVGGTAEQGLAEEAEPPPGAGIFLDPARRGARGRTWRVEDFTPPWALVTSYLAGERFVGVKLGPGLPKELIPSGVQATWVSVAGDVVEVSLWNRLEPGPVAVLLDRDGHARELRAANGTPRDLPTRDVGHYLLEPDGAVIRAGLVTEVAPSATLWLLDPHVAYLSSDEPVTTPWAQTFRVTDILDYDVATLRRWVAANRVGTLEIKKRAIDVDPAQLRARLKPRGPNTATLVLARTPSGARALVVERV